MRHRRLLGLCVALTAALAVSRFYPEPAVIDAATGQAPHDASLVFSAAHLALTPLSSAADVLSCNSARQDIAFLAFLLLGFGFFRFFILEHALKRWNEPWLVVKSLGLYLLLASAFLAGSAFIPHGAARLLLDDPNLMAVDFHSHTSYSWDGRSSFTPAANAQWHEQRGFGAGFITDHNLLEGALRGKLESKQRWAAGLRGYASLEGEEVSLQDCHVVVLGPRKSIDNHVYDGSLEGIRRFLGDAGPVYGGLAVMSLPEYWKRHWDSVEDFAKWGANGFEIVTSSPRAMDFPQDKRARIIELCRGSNLFLAGATDNHGYAAAACAWNLLRVPGWQELDPDQRQNAVLAGLRKDGFGAVRVLARKRLAPADGWRIWLDAPRALWLMVRTWTALQCALALLWLWAPALALVAFKGKTD